jgi:hypothetical protein
MAMNSSPVKAPAAPPLVMKSHARYRGPSGSFRAYRSFLLTAGIQLLGGQGERAITLLV